MIFKNLKEKFEDILAEYILKTLTKQKHKQRPKKIILIRQGQSVGNADITLYATIPGNQMKLTDLGRKQSFDISHKLKQIVQNDFIHFYVSPCISTHESFEIISQQFQKNQYTYCSDPRIREQEFGNLQLENLEPESMQARIDQRKQVGKFFFRYDNGESGADVYDRVTLFLDTLYRRIDKFPRQNKPKEQSIVIICHGMTMRMFLMRYQHLSVLDYEKQRHPNNGEMWVFRKNEKGKYLDLQVIQP